MQSPANRRDRLSYNSGLPHNVYPPSVRNSDSMTPGFAPGLASYHSAQRYCQPGIYSDPTQILTGPGRGNGVYGGSIPGYEFNSTMARFWGTPDPQLQYHNGYTMPSGPYGNLGQCETNNAGFHLTGPERGNNLNVYGGSSTPGYDFNYARVEPSGPPAPQPPNHGGYTMPNVQYGSVGQAEVNDAGRQPAIDQLSRRTMNFSPLPGPPGEYTVPNNQEASPLWCLGNCWIGYVSEDELHLTIALKKNPFA